MGRRATAIALTVTSGVLAVVAVSSLAGGPPAPTEDGPTLQGARPARGMETLDQAIAAAQTRLRSVPGDDATWAGLGAAYVQQARITGDPTYYPKAQGALEKSRELKPAGNAAALVGLGSLANARHEFAQALELAQQAEKVNAYDARVYGVMDDALTQLGRYDEAEKAVRRMLALDPGVSSFARISYHYEEQGKVDAARRALEAGLKEAVDPADQAFCQYYLGELALNQGDPRTALEHYTAGLAVDAAFDPLLAGRAKARAALGQNGAALRDYAAVVDRVPSPTYVLEYGELLQSLGRIQEAQAQYGLLHAEERLLAANGVVDDLETAVFEADHGDAATAVRAAQQEWNRRRSVLVADALAWALHRAGRDAEALPYAEEAASTGWRNATFAYHRGMIQLALGQKKQARTTLTLALAVNPHFSPLQAPAATRALATLGGPEAAR